MQKSRGLKTAALCEKAHRIHIHAIHSHGYILEAFEGCSHWLSLETLRTAPVDVSIAALLRCHVIELLSAIQLSLQLGDVSEIVESNEIGRASCRERV